MERRCEPELMDDPALSADEHREALRGLNRINRALWTDHGLFREAVRLSGIEHPSLLDLGTGGGSFLQHAARRSRRSSGGAPLRLGLDVSPRALGWAREWCGDGVNWVASDARRLPLAERSVDVVVCSLFLHHFGRADLTNILAEGARVARVGLVAGDLTRSRLAFGLTWLATRVTSRSRVFRVDGPLSVRAALRPEELSQCAHEAGLDGARVRRAFPFRMVLTWRKQT